MATPIETLEAASEEIAAGRVREGARLAYDAAFQAIADAAQRHDRPCETIEDARGFVRWMEGLPTDPDDWLKDVPLLDWFEDEQGNLLPIPELIPALDIVEEFKRHAEAPPELTSWQPNEYVFYLPAVQWIVEEMKTAQPRDPSVWTR